VPCYLQHILIKNIRWILEENKICLYNDERVFMKRLLNNIGKVWNIMKIHILIFVFLASLLSFTFAPISSVFAQEEPDLLEEAFERDLPPDDDLERETAYEDELPEQEPPKEEDREEGDEKEETARRTREVRDVFDEGAGDLAPPRRTLRITGIILANYVFETASDTFLIKYGIDIDGNLDADNAVLKGDAEIIASVEGTLTKWPSGECNLKIEIPKVPYEIVFKKTGDEKGSLRFVFKKAIDENWSSNCEWNDGARFDTTGPPEKWLALALKKTSPPLRSVVLDLKDEATSTSLVISKQIIGDPPLGTIEIEGTLTVTQSPGSEK